MNEQGKRKLSSIKKYVLEKILPIGPTIIFYIGLILGTIASVVTVLAYFYDEPTNIKYNFARYEFAKVIIYSGELINEDSLHANGLSFKGKFNSEIIRFDVSTPDSIERQEYNKPLGAVEFFLRRLSKGNSCKFDIIVDKGSEVIEPVGVSWGKKGNFKLSLNESDNKIKRGIELSEKASDLDLYHKARQKRYENNTKNIRN